MHGKHAVIRNHEEAKVVTDGSLKMTFRLLKELEHFAAVTLHGRGKVVNDERNAVEKYADITIPEGSQADPSPEVCFMRMNLVVQEAILKEAKERIHKVIQDARSDLVTLADRQLGLPLTE